MTSNLPQQSNNAIGGQPQGNQPSHASHLTPAKSSRRRSGCIVMISIVVICTLVSLAAGWHWLGMIGIILGLFLAAIFGLSQISYFNERFSEGLERLEKWVAEHDPLDSLQPAGRQLKKHRGKVAIAAILAALIGGVFLGRIIRFPNPGKKVVSTAAKPTAKPKPTTVPTPLPAYIAVSRDGYSSLMGVSGGDAAFDTTLADGPMKQQAAAVFLAGIPNSAQRMWNLLAAIEPTDAEALIYAENQRIRSVNISYFTLVVVTTFVNSDSGDNHANGTSRDILQGAYVAQQEYNRQNPSRQVLLLIANVPDPANDANKVAQLIVQAAQHDKTIVGVVGWPYDGSEGAIAILSRAGIPVVSLTIFDDELRGMQGFFSVAPSIADEGQAAALYAQKVLKAKTAIVVYDGSGTYGKDLVTSFTENFKGNIFHSLSYTPGGFETLANYLDSAMGSRPPDLLFLAGYPADAGKLLHHVRLNRSDIPVIGGDTLYQKIHCPASVCSPDYFNGLYFTSPAFPDEAERFKSAQPFFSEYSSIFDLDHSHIGSPYGYDRADSDVMLAYDATYTFLQASLRVKGNPTPQTTLQALKTINGSQALMGVSGRIEFGPDGSPQQKAILVLYIDGNGHLQIESIPVGSFY